jgi:hypothetical protein
VCNYNDANCAAFNKYIRISANIDLDEIHLYKSFIETGSPVPCFHCGEGTARETRTGHCKHCDPGIIYCNECGCLIADGEMDDNEIPSEYINGEVQVCMDCFKELYFKCDCCNQTLLRENKIDGADICINCDTKMKNNDSLIFHIQEIGADPSEEGVLDLIAKETIMNLVGCESRNFYIDDFALEDFYEQLETFVRSQSNALKVYINKKDNDFYNDSYVYGVKYINSLETKYFNFGDNILTERHLKPVINLITRYIENYDKVYIVGIISKDTVQKFADLFKELNPNIEVITDDKYIFNRHTRDLSKNRTTITPIKNREIPGEIDEISRILRG